MYLVFNPIETCYNNTSITLKISDAVNDQRAVYINGILSHHVTEDKITTLITDAGQNLWSDNPAAGAKLGRQLYDLLNRGTGMLQEIIGSARDAETHAHLYLQTPYELTHLPFELLNDGGFVLLRDDIHVIRLTENRGGRSQVTPKKTPLNMLFMACSPTDAHDKYALNFEKEEELIFGAVGNYNIDMRIEDTGSLEGLKQANIAGGGFDIIHITGHAAIDRVLGPVLYMEDDIGKTQKVAPCMLWDAIKDHKPRILFLSGCSTCRADDKANTESFACQMALKGIRWVLGWGLPVSAAGATIVSGEVYRCLSIGKGIDFAIRSARRLLEGQYHPWPLLRLFGDASPIVPLVVEGKLAHVNHVRLRHKTLQGSNVRVLESGFVGRRRYVQRGVSVLRGKTGKCGLLVRGPAGIGKSCLVGKLIERFAGKELIVFHGVVNAGDVILKLRKLLDRLGKKDALAILKSGDEYEEKIKDLFRTVFRTEVSAIIYFDDFEQNLERHGNNYYVKPETIELVRPFLEAVEWTEGNSYVVITSRYPFILEQDGENLSTAKLFDLALMSFYGADLNKKAKDLESVAKSKHAELYLKYGGGNPRLLEWLNVIARDEDKYDLAVIEAQLKLKQAEFIHEYLADVIAATEGEAFHRFIREAAVYREPVDATAFEGFGSVELLNTGVDLTLVEREVRAAPAMEDLSSGGFVYWVTPVIVDAMWGKLTPEKQLEMHGRAYQWYGDWIAKASEPNYKYMEEVVRHALEVGNIRGACPHARALGQYFDEMVLYRQGRVIMEKVAVRVSDAAIDEAKANKDISVGNFLNTYATSLWKLGEARQAIAFFEKSLAISLEVYGERHPHIADSYNNIGSAWDNLGEAKQAIAFYKKSLTIRLEVYGERHPHIADSYNNLAYMFFKTGDVQKAVSYLAKAKAAWP